MGHNGRISEEMEKGMKATMRAPAEVLAFRGDFGAGGQEAVRAAVDMAKQNTNPEERFYFSHEFHK